MFMKSPGPLSSFVAVCKAKKPLILSLYGAVLYLLLDLLFFHYNACAGYSGTSPKQNHLANPRKMCSRFGPVLSAIQSAIPKFSGEAALLVLSW